MNRWTMTTCRAGYLASTRVFHTMKPLAVGWCAAVLLVCSLSSASTRVAVIGSKAANVERLVPLVELRLAPNKETTLLERETIREIFREQELQALKVAMEKVQRKPPQGEPFDGAVHPGRETQPGNTAAELPGKTLRLIPDNGVSYRVRESHVKTGGVLPGEYAFQLKLRLSMDGQEFKVHREKYEGTSILPMQACISDFRYKAVRADGQQHELTGREMTVPPWVRGESRQMTLQGRWDTRQGRFKFSEVIGMEPDALAVHLAGVWAPALVVDFPERLKIEKGFSWGRQPQEVPRCLQQLSYLQQWTLTGSEESEGGVRLQLAAECGAGANERGPQVALKRRIVYDTRVRLVTDAVVTFESRDAEESEKVELVMELEKER